VVAQPPGFPDPPLAGRSVSSVGLAQIDSFQQQNQLPGRDGWGAPELCGAAARGAQGAQNISLLNLTKLSPALKVRPAGLIKTIP
jgi:hypothetical protein